MQQQPELQGLLDPSLYPYADQPEFITVRRHDLELCLRATISTVICEGGDIAVLARDCMRALDGLANGTDQHVLALTAENEELRLKLFWKDHYHDSLRDLLSIANQNGPNCNCLSCAVAGRKDEEIDITLPWGATCTFKSWFEKRLAELEMTCFCGVYDGMESHKPHMSDAYHNEVYDVDAHFHHLTRDDWVVWQYGAKLWKAKSVNDPEIQKLKKLFEILDPDNSED